MQINESLGCDSYALFCQAFQTYVESRFPVGSPEEALLTELKKDGFDASPTPYYPGFEHDYTYAEGQNLACGLIWRVDWQSNEQHELTKLQATYERNCL